MGGRGWGVDISCLVRETKQLGYFFWRREGLGRVKEGTKFLFVPVFMFSGLLSTLISSGFDKLLLAGEYVREKLVIAQKYFITSSLLYA